LTALPATSLWDARNTLTQRSMGPRSSPIALLDTSTMREGDVAGLALFNRPYAWIGVERMTDGTRLAVYDDQTEHTERRALAGTRVFLRADCDFIRESATFSYSLDGESYTALGPPVTLVFQLGTFQGIRYSLFAYSTAGANGGTAAFDSFRVLQPDPRGLMRPIPFGQRVRFRSTAGDFSLGMQGTAVVGGAPVAFRVRDMKLGRVALEHAGRFVSISGDGGAIVSDQPPGEAETFQWIETPDGDLALMSLVNHRFLRLDPANRRVIADAPGPLPDGSDGSRFRWR
jgi:hypothetical protein